MTGPRRLGWDDLAPADLYDHLGDTMRGMIANPDDLDSREVYDADGELDGYTIVSRRQPHQHITPVRCCRTCAWADAQHVRYGGGQGYRYAPEDSDA